MIERTRGLRGRHGAPPKDCDHHGHITASRGRLRCGRCWRVLGIYPQQIWHYANRKIGRADLSAWPHGGTI